MQPDAGDTYPFSIISRRTRRARRARVTLGSQPEPGLATLEQVLRACPKSPWGLSLVPDPLQPFPDPQETLSEHTGRKDSHWGKWCPGGCARPGTRQRHRHAGPPVAVAESDLHPTTPAPTPPHSPERTTALACEHPGGWRRSPPPLLPQASQQLVLYTSSLASQVDGPASAPPPFSPMQAKQLWPSLNNRFPVRHGT